MPITHLPHGLLATPTIGFGKLNGMAADSQVYFVDGKFAANGDGTTPDGAFNTVKQALNVAGARDTIYILDKGITGTFGAGTGIDPNPYIETASDLQIAYNKPGLALIGACNANAFPYSPQLKIRATNGNYILKVLAPFCSIENLAFNGAGGGTIRTGIWLYDDAYTLGAAYGAEIYNCYFRNCRGATIIGAANEGAAIYSGGGWGYRILNCVFEECRQGVVLYSNVATVQGVLMAGLTFLNTDGATNIDADIYTYVTATNSLQISDIVMAHVLPNYAAGKARYIYMAGSENGSMVRVYMMTTGLTYGAAGTGIHSPATMLGGQIYSANALAAYA